MPTPDENILGRRAEVVAALRAIVPGEGVIDHPDELRPYESDGLTAYRQPPMVVVLPETVDQVAAVLRKVVPRGRRHLAVGRRPAAGRRGRARLGKFNRILDIDYDNRSRWCSRASPTSPSPARSRREGFYYAPDPSSQIACSIGGNVAENSGGVHCLKYGLTTNNVLGVELVLIDGEVCASAARASRPGGLDLLGVVVGSEGLLGVVTEVTVRILPRPETARALLIGFPTVERRRSASPRSSPRASSPRHGDDGPAGDPRRRGLRAGRLSAGRRGPADRRARRAGRPRSTT
jgi:glycolate oxidase